MSPNSFFGAILVAVIAGLIVLGAQKFLEGGRIQTVPSYNPPANPAPPKEAAPEAEKKPPPCIRKAAFGNAKTEDEAKNMAFNVTVQALDMKVWQAYSSTGKISDYHVDMKSKCRRTDADLPFECHVLSIFCKQWQFTTGADGKPNSVVRP